MNDFQLLYDSEDFSVLLPTYLASAVSDSSEIGQTETENGEDDQYNQDTDNSSSYNLDDVYANQVTMIAAIDNLNSNVCIMNDNLITMNSNLLYLIGVSALALFFTLVNFVIRIFNNTLGLGKV